MKIQRFWPEFEPQTNNGHGTDKAVGSVAEEHPTLGYALGQVVEAHADLAPLLDFYASDPRQIARAVGMISPSDVEDEDDLGEIDLGPGEWYEATAGIAAVRAALRAIRARPQSIGETVYNPKLNAVDVLKDLEEIETLLSDAQDSEVRFHFVEQE